MLRRLFEVAMVMSLCILSTGLCANADSTGYIDTPDECCIVQKTDVKAKTVYLVSAGKCGGMSGRAYVNLSGKVRVLRDGVYWADREVQPLGTPDVADVLLAAKKTAANMVKTPNIHEKEMVKEAEKTVAFFNSKEYQARISQESARLRHDLFGVKGEEKLVPKEPVSESKSSNRLGPDERVYLFLSSSMPMQTVRNYIASVARMGDPNIKVVMRGFVGGMKKVGPTVAFISKAIYLDADCDPGQGKCPAHNIHVGIDPQLFRKYGIDRVPTVVYARGVSIAPPEQSEGGDSAKVSSSVKVSGDASLEYILGKISQTAGAGHVQQLLSKK